MKRSPTVASPYRIRADRPAALLSMALMLLCAAIRITYYAIRGASALELLIYLALPVAAALWLVAVILFCGREHVEWSVASVLAGVVFFIVKATTFASPLHTGLCIVLYLGVLALFSLTVTGIIPTKKLLYPLFSLPLAYHILVEDMQLYVLADPRPPALEWLPEISVLCIMGALLAFSVALDKKETTKD
jgi:hypothetical protein